MAHVVLLGDSTFDNGAYVSNGPDVTAQLRQYIGPDDRVSLLAVDGSMVDDAHNQLDRLPLGATHIVISVGGNDALDHLPRLEDAVGTIADGLLQIGALAAAFGSRHRAMLRQARSKGLPVAVGTIYDGNLKPPQGLVAPHAAALFNDAITRNAFITGADLIDLRLICTVPADYANPIEPSVQGGGKIARAIADWLEEERRENGPSRVFV
ncbi:SGNH/GDSL hydrolase family protein [Altererythrobacter xixiisoli]|uniref:SGNH/GDSL hydrolase family protein n=1 Tax=Croceibacterium xixiisoli TaxID=1476466 RepID=A0A6I4TV14_9SPHN|nr:GDSL-type esterase/lipase family protein [Croceibacterium xixiisoli]MXO99060.1 SGNH/GDSL hydrolase family protein [Croceibacterium xixiisoli]